MREDRHLEGKNENDPPPWQLLLFIASQGETRKQLMFGEAADQVSSGFEPP